MAEKKDIDEMKKNITCMRKKLAEARNDLLNQPFVVEYDNGGGQSGVRENPFFPAYEKLLKSYQSLLKQIDECKDESEEVDKPAKLTVVGGTRWSRKIS